MRSFTLDSDKKFFLYFLLSLVILVSGFYIYVESNAQSMSSRKTDERYINFTQNLKDYRIDLVVMGTSHSERADFLGNPHVFNLSAPHDVPTVMYFRAKTIIKFHPEVKTVYLEADDHLFFNGTYYNLDGFDAVQKRNSKIFVWNAAYIDSDDEKEKVFGKVAPYSQDPWMLFKDDVKPVIIKRIINRWYGSDVPSKPDRASDAGQPFPCNLSAYPESVKLTQDSEWSKRTDTDKKQRMDSRLDEHHLNLPGPMKDIQLTYYEKTIAMLKAHHIDVVLVLNPELPEFIRMKNPDGQKIHQRFIQEMSQRYHLRILDMGDLSRYGERLFEDQEHIDGRYGWLIGKRIMEDFCAQQEVKKTD